MTETTLRPWLDRAWDEHPTATQRIADELIARAATLPADDDGAEAVRLAEHVMLAHLADPATMRRFLAPLPPGEALAASVARASWALAVIDGEPEPDVPDSARWRGLLSVVVVDVARGQIERARRRLLAEEDAAAAHPDNGAQRGYATTANNVAQDLRLGPRGDAARDALMIEAALLARRAWARAGTWMHTERADYQLAMCHAVLGQGEQAVPYADACLARCEAEGAEPSERFFAHECCVHAQRAAGDTAKAAAHRERMAVLLDEVSDPAMKTWCSDTLATT